MSAKQDSVNQIREKVETVRSHVADLKKVASKKKNEQVTESLGVLVVCLDSLESAIEEKQLNTAPVLVLAFLVKNTSEIAVAIANAVSNIDAQGGNFTNLVNLLHRSLWADRLIDPLAEVRAHRAAVGTLDSDMSVVRDRIVQLEEGLKLRDQVEAAATAVKELQERAAMAASSAATDERGLDQLLTDAT